MSKTRVGHCMQDDTDTYIGRGQNQRDLFETPIGERGWLGNPFTLDDYERDESIAKFKEVFLDRIESDQAFQSAVEELRGDTLGCWCQNLNNDGPACHGEVIAEYLNRL